MKNMMRPLTHFRLFLAQFIMMLSFILFGAVEVRDHHWPNWCVYVVTVIGALLGFLIPDNSEAYQIVSGLSSTQYFILCVTCGKRYADGARFFTPKNADWMDDDGQHDAKG